LVVGLSAESCLRGRLSNEGLEKALSSDACRIGGSMGVLMSNEGRLALLIGREKLKAGRGSWDPAVENSDEIEGDRRIEALLKGVYGDCARERLEL
jgi:hypothetical protein